MIYRGTFASGMFQCVYQPGPAHWAMLPTTLEWHAVAAVLAFSGLAGWFHGASLAAAMLGLSMLLATLQALQATVPRPHEGIRSRLLVAWLCYAQPLVRSWARYWTRLAAHREIQATPPTDQERFRLPLWGTLCRAYWDDRCRDRTELLHRGADELVAMHWAKEADAGWSDWDLQFSRDPWTVVRVSTVQEDHGSGRRLIRLRFVLMPDVLMPIGVVGVAGALAATSGAWLVVAGAATLAGIIFGQWRCARRAAGVVAAFDRVATSMGLVRIEDERRAGGGAVAALEGDHA
jgi:hypothetical protein